MICEPNFSQNKYHITASKHIMNITEITDYIHNSLIKHGSRNIIEECDLSKYYINRILTLHNIFNVHELGIPLNPPSILDEDLAYTFLDNKTKIAHLIKREYGSIDPRLCHKEWYVAKIDKSDIIPYYKYYDNTTDELSYYNDHNYDPKLPRCILLKEDNRYRIIDGYYRIVNTTKDRILAIVAD